VPLALGFRRLAIRPPKVSGSPFGRLARGEVGFSIPHVGYHWPDVLGVPVGLTAENKFICTPTSHTLLNRPGANDLPIRIAERAASIGVDDPIATEPSRKADIDFKSNRVARLGIG
jgi:hypothetical protein